MATASELFQGMERYRRENLYNEFSAFLDSCNSVGAFVYSSRGANILNIDVIERNINSLRFPGYGNMLWFTLEVWYRVLLDITAFQHYGPGMARWDDLSGFTKFVDSYGNAASPTHIVEVFTKAFPQGNVMRDTAMIAAQIKDQLISTGIHFLGAANLDVGFTNGLIVKGFMKSWITSLVELGRRSGKTINPKCFAELY